jgi:peroxiredoxin
LGVAAAFVVLGASVAALLLVPRHSRPIAAADLGTVAPDFQLRDLTGRAVSLSDFRGHAVVLYFGSTHDAKTAGYNARVHNLARRYVADDRVKFLALEVTRPGEARVDATALRDDADLSRRPFPTLLDDRGAVAARYSAGAREIPMIVLIDRRGRVSYRGPFDDHPDFAFATQQFCADALREVLGPPGAILAKSN